jgi:hypothetical protein
MEGLLSKGCTWLGTDLPNVALKAQKCGVVGSLGLRHEAALIENGGRRYVLVYLTRNLPMSDALRTRFVGDLDGLIRANNPGVP